MPWFSITMQLQISRRLVFKNLETPNSHHVMMTCRKETIQIHVISYEYSSRTKMCFIYAYFSCNVGDPSKCCPVMCGVTLTSSINRPDPPERWTCAPDIRWLWFRQTQVNRHSCMPQTVRWILMYIGFSCVGRAWHTFLKKNKLVQSSCTNQTCWISVLHTCVFVLPSDEYSVDIDLLANNAGTRVEFDPFWLMCWPVQLSMPANTCWWITVFIVFCRSCYFILKTFPLFNSI